MRMFCHFKQSLMVLASLLMLTGRGHGVRRFNSAPHYFGGHRYWYCYLDGYTAI